MRVVEKFIRSLLSKYGKHVIYTDGDTWYPQTCNFLPIKHRLHSPLEKSLIDRVMQYFKDRTECFDDYYPCIKKSNDNCDLQHVYNWIKLFIYLDSTTKNANSYTIKSKILVKTVSEL